MKKDNLFQLLPEWHVSRTIVIAWPYQGSHWDGNLEDVQACYFGMVKNIVSHCSMLILLHPSITLECWLKTAEKFNIQLEKVNVVCFIEYNDTWVRDYLALSLSSGYKKFSFNGWGNKYPFSLNNQVSKKIAIEYKSTLDHESFILEGGAIDINSQGCLLANLDCVQSRTRETNIEIALLEKKLRKTLGVKDFAWIKNIQLSGDDTDGHIDTLARFVNDNTILYSGRNEQHVDADALSTLEKQLKVLAQQYQWTIIPLPTPEYFSPIDGGQRPITYANFLIANGAIFMPNYGVKEDVDANNIVTKAVGDQYKVIPIRCEALLEQFGSLHRATMQLAYYGSERLL